MAKYKKMAKSPGRRDPELQRKDLMIENTNQRAYDLNVPGLFDDEEALELDTGELVAASVEPEWLPNGVALHAWLRWMNEDGSSKEVHGKPIELSLSHSFDHETLRRHSLKALAKEMVQVMLGEPPTMTPVVGLPQPP